MAVEEARPRRVRRGLVSGSGDALPDGDEAIPEPRPPGSGPGDARSGGGGKAVGIGGAHALVDRLTNELLQDQGIHCAHLCNALNFDCQLQTTWM